MVSNLAPNLNLVQSPACEKISPHCLNLSCTDLIQCFFSSSLFSSYKGMWKSSESWRAALHSSLDVCVKGSRLDRLVEACDFSGDRWEQDLEQWTIVSTTSRPPGQLSLTLSEAYEEKCASVFTWLDLKICLSCCQLPIMKPRIEKNVGKK